MIEVPFQNDLDLLPLQELLNRLQVNNMLPDEKVSDTNSVQLYHLAVVAPQGPFSPLKNIFLVPSVYPSPTPPLHFFFSEGANQGPILLIFSIDHKVSFHLGLGGV